MRKLLLLPLLIIGSSVWANCDNKTGHAYSKCISEELAKSQAELTSAYRKAYSDSPKYSQSDLSTAQKTWLKYRDAECKYQVSLNSTSPDYPVDSITDLDLCITSFNQKRIIELND